MTLRSHRLCVAPMMDWTDRHCRVFLRLISSRVALYTEMVTAAAILHGPRDRLLGHDACEHPLALQLGGSEPSDLAAAVRAAEPYGFDEINLNIGCPSDRVSSGRFGACLMAEPARVAACVAAMRAATGLPVTVKCRIGIDDQDAEAGLDTFVDTVADAGCTTFIVHARKAWLKGLSPKQNRDVPPLDYDRVHRLKQRRPELEIILNGGIVSLNAAEAHLGACDGIMLGRAAYHDPYLLAQADARLFGDTRPAPSRGQVMAHFMDYVEAQLSRGTPLHRMTRHILGLYQGQPGARAFRRTLSEGPTRDTAGLALIEAALGHVEADRTYSPGRNFEVERDAGGKPVPTLGQARGHAFPHPAVAAE